MSVPNEILADITIMRLDRSLSVADLDLPEGVVSLIPDEISVAAPVIPRAIEEPEPVEGEGVEGEEGAESGEGAEGAEGKAPEGGGDSE